VRATNHGLRDLRGKGRGFGTREDAEGRKNIQFTVGSKKKLSGRLSYLGQAKAAKKWRKGGS